MKTISFCPVCKTRTLVQDFGSYEPSEVIGGSHSTRPPLLDGCHCSKCGTKYVFDKAGACPGCKGTGQFTSIHGHCGIEEYRTKNQCSICDGKGKL